MSANSEVVVMTVSYDSAGFVIIVTADGEGFAIRVPADNAGFVIVSMGVVGVEEERTASRGDRQQFWFLSRVNINSRCRREGTPTRRPTPLTSLV